MAVYDSDLQAAVDATSVAKDAKATDDLEGYLRAQLAEREIETQDDDWVRRVVASIEENPNFMVEETPSDYDPPDRDV
jgi:hypothetical protein